MCIIQCYLSIDHLPNILVYSLLCFSNDTYLLGDHVLEDETKPLCELGIYDYSDDSGTLYLEVGKSKSAQNFINITIITVTGNDTNSVKFNKNNTSVVIHKPGRVFVDLNLDMTLTELRQRVDRELFPQNYDPLSSTLTPSLPSPQPSGSRRFRSSRPCFPDEHEPYELLYEHDEEGREETLRSLVITDNACLYYEEGAPPVRGEISLNIYVWGSNELIEAEGLCERLSSIAKHDPSIAAAAAGVANIITNTSSNGSNGIAQTNTNTTIVDASTDVEMTTDEPVSTVTNTTPTPTHIKQRQDLLINLGPIKVQEQQSISELYTLIYNTYLSAAATTATTGDNEKAKLSIAVPVAVAEDHFLLRELRPDSLPGQFMLLYTVVCGMLLAALLSIECYHIYKCVSYLIYCIFYYILYTGKVLWPEDASDGKGGKGKAASSAVTDISAIGTGASAKTRSTAAAATTTTTTTTATKLRDRKNLPCRNDCDIVIHIINKSYKEAYTAPGAFRVWVHRLTNDLGSREQVRA